MACRTEINFNRLLHQLEEMVSEKRTGEWRFDKYLASLNTMLHELSSTPQSNPGRPATDRPSSEVLRHYRTKVNTLSQVLEATRSSHLEDRLRLVNSISGSSAHPDNLPPCADLQPEDQPPRETSAGSGDRGTQLVVKEKAALFADMRQELLGGGSPQPGSSGEKDDEGGVTGGDQASHVIQRQRALQETITDDMLGMVRNLKTISKSAGSVVREDTAVLEKSMRFADSNMSQLKTETTRLDRHLESSCNWTVWVMVVLVIVTFIGMVLFMRFFKKT